MFKIHIKIETESESFAVTIDEATPALRNAAGQIIVEKMGVMNAWNRARHDAQAWLDVRHPQIGEACDRQA